MDLVRDDVRKLFYQYLFPAVSSALAVAIYSLVDTIAIGQGIGPQGAAACALVLPIFSIAIFIGLLCGIGGSVLMSHARGCGNREKGDAYFTAAIVCAAVLTAAAWLPGNLLQEGFYRLCGADEALLPYALDYGRWIFAALPSFMLAPFLGAFIRMDGSPRFVMAATLICGVVNMIGDWLFVFPLQMGMAGAAMATVLGSLVQSGLLLGYILLKKTGLRLAKPYRWRTAFRKILISGFGAGVGQLAVIAVSVIANNQIMKYAGAAALAVYGVLGTVSSLFQSIFSGIGQAAQPIVAASYGAGRTERCQQSGALGMRWAVALSLAFAAGSAAFPVWLTGLFMRLTADVAAVAPYILRVYALSYPPMAVCVFAIYYLQAVMRPKEATRISLARGLILNCAFLFLFPLVWDGGGIWWAIVAAEAVTAGAAVRSMLRRA